MDTAVTDVTDNDSFDLSDVSMLGAVTIYSSEVVFWTIVILLGWLAWNLISAAWNWMF